MSRNSKIVLIAAGLLVLCVLCIGTGYVLKSYYPIPFLTGTGTETPIILSPTQAEPTEPAVEPTETASVEKLPFHSVVQITAQFEQSGDLVDSWTGSGSIISPDGLILTNAHVVLPEQNFPVDKLLVSITGSPDEVPTPSYYAKVMQADPELDLAVIQITTDLGGNEVDPASLNLPAVPIGDSDALTLGDSLSILGYPGIGGETITLTGGEVSGFTGEASYGNRAFIKTNATIAGGNSGGLAVNEKGELIGVPTQLGYGGDQDVVDCRILADTNGDGRIDNNDTCIPTGGFINSLRPINLALPMIERARNGEVSLPEQDFFQQDEAVPTEGVLFSDSFLDPSSGWEVFSDEEGSVGYQGGQYEIEVLTPNLARWGVAQRMFEDTNINVVVHIVNATGDGDFGIICRYVDMRNFYALEISEDGYAAIWKRLNGAVQVLVDWTYVGELSGETHNLSATCNSSNLSLSMDGQEVVSANDADFTSGDIGLLAGTNQTGGLLVTFDNLVVTAP